MIRIWVSVWFVC